MVLFILVSISNSQLDYGSMATCLHKYLFEIQLNFRTNFFEKKMLRLTYIETYVSEKNLFLIKLLAVSGGLGYVTGGFKRTFKEKH